ncbi:MAG: disulfide bond formation protein B [Alphaproteobacteria bacterium]|nr:disulfide bond formation protein B [Alphaproteobacteria bacterium]
MIHRFFYIVIAFVSAGALSAALIAQYGFHLEPCAFCIYERYPYLVALALSLMGLWKPSWGSVVKICLFLCFLTGASITTYHILIEHHWVEPPSSCVSKFEITDDTTVADLEAQVNSTARVIRCDIVPIKIFGLSLAEYNLLLSFVLIFMCLRKNNEAKNS